MVSQEYKVALYASKQNKEQCDGTGVCKGMVVGEINLACRNARAKDERARLSQPADDRRSERRPSTACCTDLSYRRFSSNFVCPCFLSQRRFTAVDIINSYIKLSL